jgi:hypothetical protein
MSIRIKNGAMVKWKNSLKGIMSDRREMKSENENRQYWTVLQKEVPNTNIK